MKKLITLGLTAAMVASLTACGGGSGADATTAAAGGDSTTAAAGTGDATAAADNSGAGEAAGGTFKIGVIGPLTGPAAAYGIAVWL